MKKIIKAAASKLSAATATPAAKQVLTDEEKLAQWAGLNCQNAVITGGKKFPVNTACESVEIRLNRFHQPFAVILVAGDQQEFCDPKFIKAIKPMTPARAAAAMALVEENRSATTFIAARVLNETFEHIDAKGKLSKGAVCCKHRDWFQSKWIPKSYVTIEGEHADGVQSILAVTTWKLKQIVGSLDGFTSLVKESETLESMIDERSEAAETREAESVKPAKAKATPVEPVSAPVPTLPAKAVTTVIKRSVLKRSAK